MKSFHEAEFYQLDEDRLALRLPAMRETIHLLPRKTAEQIFSATIPPAEDPYWEKRYAQKGRMIPSEEYSKWKKEIITVLSNPLIAAEIKLKLDIPEAMIKLLLNRMAFEGIVLRIGARSLRSNTISYVATKSWIEKAIVHRGQDKALVWLAGEYLHAFGPARIKDFQWWTGITSGKAKTAMAELDTIPVGNELLLLKKDLPGFETFTLSGRDSLNLLPQWDPYSMGYAPDGRERLVDPAMQQYIYGSIGATSGNALGAVLINGLAHGSWDFRFSGEKMMVKLKMFEKPTQKVLADIEKQIGDVALFMKAKTTSIDKIL